MSVQDKTGTSRRGQALTGAFAGVAVIAVLVAVYIGIQVSDDPAPASRPRRRPRRPPTRPPRRPPSPPRAPQPAEPPAAQTPLDPALQQPPVVKAGKGKVTELKVTPIIEGKGPKLQAGQTIQANYVGVTYQDGKEFDSSWKRGQPAAVPGRRRPAHPGLGPGPGRRAGGQPGPARHPRRAGLRRHAPEGRPGGDLRFVVDVLAAQ